MTLTKPETPSRVTRQLRELLSPAVYGSDHRGQRVLIAPNPDQKKLPQLAPRVAEPVPVPKPNWRSWALGSPASSVSFGGLVWILGWQLVERSGLAMPEWQRALLFCSGMVLAAYVGMLLGPGKRARQRQIPTITHWALRRGLCPGCGQSLAGLSEEADGCVVCPECSAAWSLGAFAASARFDEPPRPDSPTRPKVHDVRNWAYPCAIRMPKRALEMEADRTPSDLHPALSWELWIGPIAGAAAGTLVFLRDGELGPALFAIFLVTLVLLGVGAYFFGKRLRRRKLARWCKTQVGRGSCPCCDGALKAADERLGVSLLCENCGGWWSARVLPTVDMASSV